MATSLSVIDCMNLHGEWPSSAQGFEKHSAKFRMEKFCEGMSSHYEGVKLTLVSRNEKKIKNIGLGLQNLSSTNVETLKSGRVKLEWLEFMEDGSNKNVKKVTSWYKVSAVQDVWIVKKTISQGQILKKRNVKKVSRDVSVFSGGAPALVQKHPKGMYVKRRIGKGTVLTENYIVKAPLLLQNDFVDVLALRGNLKFEFKAQVVTSAWDKGDKVRLRMKNGKLITGIVMGEGKAYVEL